MLAGCDRTPLSALNPASEQADHIADVWQAMAWGSLSVLLMMLALVFLAIRARSSGRPGRRPLWLLLGGGILFPLSVMAALLAYAYLAAPAQGAPAYRVQVTGHRWWWEVRYPQASGAARYSINVLHVPQGVPVSIELTASDVIHSFWVPRLGGKMDAIPGRINTLVYTPAKRASSGANAPSTAAPAMPPCRFRWWCTTRTIFPACLPRCPPDARCLHDGIARYPNPA